MSGQHVTWAELLPVIRKALPSESEFSDAVANNIAAAVSEYLLNRDEQACKNACCNDMGMADYASVPCPNPSCTAVATNEPARGRGRRRDGRGQGQPVAMATPDVVASSHTAVAVGHDADGHVTMEVVPRASGTLIRVSHEVGAGGRGFVRSESASESRWTGSHYATAEKLAAEHGLRVKRVGNDGVTSWTRS